MNLIFNTKDKILQRIENKLITKNIFLDKEIMNPNNQRNPLQDSTNLLQNYHTFGAQSQKPFQKISKPMAQQIYLPYPNQCLGDKQNPLGQIGKKLKLKLKSVASREPSKNQQQKPTLELRKQAQQRLRQVNSVPKRLKIESQLNQNRGKKQGKIDGYFKPNVIYFSLKSLRQHEMTVIQEKQVNNEGNSLNAKEKHNVKNYPLSGFISQVVSKLLNVFPSLFNKNITSTALLSHSIVYSDLIALLHSISMIRYPSEAEYKIQHQDQKEQLQKVYLLWRILKSNTKTNHVDVLNVVLLLSTIINTDIRCVQELIEVMAQKFNSVVQKKQTYIQQVEDRNNVQQPTQIFLIRNKKLVESLPRTTYQDRLIFNLNEEIKLQLIKEFKLFRINRLNVINSAKFGKENLQISEVEQFDLGSLISPKSKQLALSKRIKILEQLQSYNSEQKSQTKDSLPQHQLNLFLNYKSSKKCQPNPSQNKPQEQKEKPSHYEVNLKQQRIKQNKPISQNNKNAYIPSQKIKFSELNVVKNMQKARQLKLQKQTILDKGWTNNGRITSKSSGINSTRSTSNSQAYSTLNAEGQGSCKNRVKSPQVKKSFFESRKNSLPGIKKLYQLKDLNKKAEKQLQEDGNFYLQCQNQGQQTIRQIQVLEEIPRDSIQIDDNESLDLEDENQINQNQDDLVLLNQPQLQKDEEQTKNKQALKQEKRRALTQFQKNPTQLAPDQSPTSSNTFTSQENQLPQQPPSQKTQPQPQPQGKQHRVIKSYLKIPILYVDVNMDESKKERIIIYEEDDPHVLAKEFAQKHGLDGNMVTRLENMLKEQVSGILGRIDEDDGEYDETQEDVFRTLPLQDYEDIQHL